MPEELAYITDPIDINYILVRLKRGFNDIHKSDYLKYMTLQLPYHSRRDEIGGAISNEEHRKFIDRLEGIIYRISKRRKRIIRRRKKKSNKKMLRKTLFKPIQRRNMLNNPLWCEVYMKKDGGEENGFSADGDPEDGYSSTDELLE